MDIRRVDLNLLVVLETLLLTCSVTRTAHALDMSQPAVSYALDKLRRTLGDPLFIRASRGLQPTPHGASLLQPVQSVLDSIRRNVLLGPSFDPAAAERDIVLNMSDIGELVFLPTLHRHLRAHAPGIRIRTANVHAEELETALRTGDIDLAIGYFPELRGASIYQQRLFGHSFVCLVRDDHPFAAGEITRRQYAAAEHGLVRPEGQSQKRMEDLLQHEGLARRIVIQLKHYLAIPAILEASDVIFTVPYAIGERFSKGTGIRMLRPPFATPRADIKQHWHARFNNEPANRWIRSVVAELFLDQRRRKP
jgi:DNA-binding transcriptional LysR family regulator